MTCIRRTGLCISVGIALVLVGCQSTSPTTGSGTGGSSASRVVFGWPSDAGQNYDPQSTASPAVGSYLAPVFDTLVKVDSEGKIGPDLATKWEFGDADASLTLTLRKDVVFHDGTPFDAAAVKANIERGKTLKTSAVANQLAGVTDVQVVDPQTVKLSLSGGAGTLLPLFGGQAGMMISPKAFANADLRTHPVGTGPFQVSDESVPGKSMVYTKFDKYWDPSVQGISTFVIRVVGPEAQAAGMNDGSINILLLTSNPQDADSLKAAGNVIGSTGLEYVHTLFLSKKGVFADEHARRALSYAIDRQLIAKTVLLGQCDPTGQPFKPSSWAYDPNTPAPKQDDALVKQELAAANLPDGFQFKTVVSGVGTFLPSIAQAIQAMVAKDGITMTVEPLPPAQLLQTFADGGAQAYYSTQSGAADPSAVIARITTSLSPGGTPSGTLAELATKGSDTADQSQRQQVYQQWSAQYQKEAFHIGICNQDVKFAHTPNVTVKTFGDPLTVDPRGITVK